MGVNPDFRDLLAALRDAEARYLVVGALAVTFHAAPRYSKDIDIWVDPAPENAGRVWIALQRFGAPLDQLRRDDLTDPRTVYQIGVEPNRIDVLTSVEGLSFAAAWEGRVESNYGGVPIWILSLDDLIISKRAAGRAQGSSRSSCRASGSSSSIGNREVRRQGRKLRLQNQPFEVLALLVERAGKLVTREELRQRLWPHGTFVDFEQGLNAAVRKLRAALDDDAQSPRFIETAAGHGYRFIAPVERIEISRKPKSLSFEPPARTTVILPGRERWRRKLRWGLRTTAGDDR